MGGPSGGFSPKSIRAFLKKKSLQPPASATKKIIQVEVKIIQVEVAKYRKSTWPASDHCSLLILLFRSPSFTVGACLVHWLVNLQWV